MKQKGFAPILIILVGIVIIGAVFFAPKFFSKLPSNNQSGSNSSRTGATVDPKYASIVGYSASSFIPQRNYVYKWDTLTNTEKLQWKTYTNSQDDFSIQYPDNWYQGSSILTPDRPCPKCGGFPVGISIEIIDNKDNLTATDFVKNKILLDKNGEPQVGFIIKNQPSYFSSIDAVVVDGLSGGGNPGPAAYIRNSNKIIVLWSDGLNNNTLVSKIFSTFKFSQ